MIVFVLGGLIGLLAGVMMCAAVDTKTKADVSRKSMVCHFADRAYRMVEIDHDSQPEREDE